MEVEAYQQALGRVLELNCRLKVAQAFDASQLVDAGRLLENACLQDWHMEGRI